MAPGINKDLNRKLSIVRAMHQDTRIDIHGLIIATGLPKPTIARHIADLRTSYQMTISYYRFKESIEAQQGYYEIEDWGLLNESRVVED